MATSLGSLVVSLGLNAAEITSGLNKAEYDAKRLADRLDKAIRVGATFAAAAVASIGAAATTAYAAVVQLSGQAGNFKDLEEKTGASAEALARFATSAAVTNTPIETIATAMNKLSKGLVSTEDETKDAGAALQALGIDIETFKSLSPDEQFKVLAEQLNKFADGGGKSAASMALLGRAGAELLPFFKEYANESSNAVRLTQAQIERADEFSDKQARARADFHQYAQVIATELLPTITDFIRTAKELAKEILGIGAESSKLRNNRAIADWANEAALAIAFVIDAADGVGRIFRITGNVLGATAAQIAALSRGDLAAYNAIQEDASRTIDGIIAKQGFRLRLEKNINETTRNEENRAKEDRGFKPKLPPVPFTGKDTADKGAEALALAKKALDGQLKAIESFIQEEKDLLSARESYLSDSYQAGYLSVTAFYDQTQKAREDNLRETLAAYDREIKATEEYSSKLTKESDKQDATNKIAEFRDKQTKAIRQAGYENDKFERDRERANEEWAKQLDDLTAKTLELRGQTAQANALRFDSSNLTLRRKLESNGAGTLNLDFQREAARAQDVLNEKTRDYSQLLEFLSINNQRAAAAVASGQLTELESLQFISKNTQAAMAGVKAALDEATASAAELARVLGPENPATKAALLTVESLKTKYLELSVTGDLVAKKFNDIFSSAIESAANKFLDSTKSLKDRLKDFFKDISSDVVKQVSGVAIKNLLQKGFGEGGPLEFLGKGASSLFGLGTKDPMSAAGLSLTTAGTSLNTAAAQLLSAAFALKAGGGEGAGGLFGSLFGSGGISPGSGSSGFFNPESPFQGPSFGYAAGGTDYWRGGDLMVGESGPEILSRVPRGARVIPNHRMGAGGGAVTNIVVNVPPGADTRSIRQQTLAGVYQAQTGWKRR